MSEEANWKPGWKVITRGPNKGKLVRLSGRERALYRIASIEYRYPVADEVLVQRYGLVKESDVRKVQEFCRRLVDRENQNPYVRRVKGLPPLQPNGEPQKEEQQPRKTSEPNPLILLAPFITVAPYILIIWLGSLGPTVAKIMGLVVLMDVVGFFLFGRSRRRKFLPLFWWI